MHRVPNPKNCPLPFVPHNNWTVFDNPETPPVARMGQYDDAHIRAAFEMQKPRASRRCKTARKVNP